MNNLFRNILQDGEEVIYCTKANKKPYILKRMIAPFIIFVVITTLFTLLAIFVPYRYSDEWRMYMGMPKAVPIAIGSALLLINVIVLIASNGGANNYAIAVTDKRIIVRCGAFRADYQSYPLDMVIAEPTIICDQSIFDKKDGNDCSLRILVPTKTYIRLFTPSLVDGYTFSKHLQSHIKERVVEADKIKVM